jgi:ketosteroid isomerase-like protein
MVGAVETGIFRSTGRRYEVHWMQVFRFRDGRIFYFREFCDSASLIEAAR